MGGRGNLKLFLHKVKVDTSIRVKTIPSLKIQKPNCYFHQSEYNKVWLQSKIYYPLCEGMWQRLPYQMSFNISSLFIKHITCTPFKSSVLRWTDHLQQESSKSTLPIPQYTTIQLLSCNPIHLPHSFPLSPHWVRAGKLCLIGTARNLSFFLRKKTFTFIIYAYRATAQKPERSALIQVPGFSSSLIITYCQRYMK